MKKGVPKLSRYAGLSIRDTAIFESRKNGALFNEIMLTIFPTRLLHEESRHVLGYTSYERERERQS